jgi:hypothetical protein
MTPGSTRNASEASRIGLTSAGPSSARAGTGNGSCRVASRASARRRALATAPAVLPDTCRAWDELSAANWNPPPGDVVRVRPQLGNLSEASTEAGGHADTGGTASATAATPSALTPRAVPAPTGTTSCQAVSDLTCAHRERCGSGGLGMSSAPAAWRCGVYQIGFRIEAQVQTAQQPGGSPHAHTGRRYSSSRNCRGAAE